MNNFLHYIINSNVHTQDRVRRDALNFKGAIFKILFGVATQQQVDTIHQRLQSTETLTEKERIMLNVHSYMDVLHPLSVPHKKNSNR